MGSRVWGRGSQRNLAQVHHKLQAVANKVLKLRDHSVIDGYRNEGKQTTYFLSGVSKVRFPNSKHNKMPSQAIDIQPYPYNEDTLREDLTLLAGLYIGVASELGINIRWGGDWNENGETADNNFDDLFHLELAGGDSIS